MTVEKLPLFEIFKSLQRHGLPLGVDEYLVLGRSLAAGFGIESRDRLEQLCCMLWGKSEDETRLIKRLFQRMWMRVEVEARKEEKGDRPSTSTSSSASSSTSKLEVSSNETSASAELSSEDLSPEIPETETSPSDDLSSELETPGMGLGIDDPVQIVQAVQHRQRDKEIKRPRYSLLDEYFPVTKRQMKQTWRYLRRPVREGIPVELDVEATVEKIGRNGFLLAPVLVPRRVNRTDLVLLIDREGSMVPFHALSQQLVETAQRDGKLRQTRVYYFHDYPREYLYRHPALLNAQPISEMLAEVGERAVVLIISDAGAARGYFDEERVEYTQEFILQLQQSVRYYAWLNPMPEDDWRDNTAGEIAQFVPMFEMSRGGMSGAINVLRGRYVS